MGVRGGPLALEARKRKMRVMDFVLQGMVDPRRIAAALGVGLGAVQRDLAWCRQTLALRDQNEIQEKRAEQAARFLEIAYKALTAFERSKESTETVTTVYGRTACRSCRGTGMVGEEEWCKECDGEGTVEEEQVTRKQVGTPGDPQFLRVAIEAFDKYAKVYQLYPPYVKVHYKDQRQVNLTNIDLSGVPEDAIIEARRAVLRLRALAGQPAVVEEGERGNGEGGG